MQCRSNLKMDLYNEQKDCEQNNERKKIEINQDNAELEFKENTFEKKKERKYRETKKIRLRDISQAKKKEKKKKKIAFSPQSISRDKRILLCFFPQNFVMKIRVSEEI